MITAVIVLFVVALALGGYIAFDILWGRKHVASAKAERAAVKPQATEARSTPTVQPKATERPTAEKAATPESSPKAATKTEAKAALPDKPKAAPKAATKAKIKAEPNAEAGPTPIVQPKTEPSVQSKVVPTEVRGSVTAKEVDTLMNDDVAASLIEKSDGKTDRTKQSIINIDTLAQYFDSGETVTLDEIKKRVKGFNQKTTYIKVLARGTLDKPITVEADNFSLQAVKMIVLTGGKAVKKR